MKLRSGHYLILDSPVKFVDGSSRTRLFIWDARRRIFTVTPGGLQKYKLPDRSALVRIGYSVLAHDDIRPSPAPEAVRDRHDGTEQDPAHEAL